jgi:hypothetical protein
MSFLKAFIEQVLLQRIMQYVKSMVLNSYAVFDFKLL